MLPRTLLPFLALGLLGLPGCPEDTSGDPSVQSTLYQLEDGTWIAQVIVQHQEDAGYWDGFSAVADGEALALVSEEYEREDGSWSQYQVALQGDLTAGDEVLVELDHPDLGAMDVSMTICETLADFETDPPFEEWSARVVDGDPGNDTLTVTTEAPAHATDLMASLMLMETADSVFGPTQFQVENGRVAAYVETTSRIALPDDADGDEWSTFWTTFSDRWEECADLSIQLYVHWQWDDYLDWGDGIVIEAKHATLGLRDEVPLFTPDGGYGAWQCDCTCSCETCDGDTSGLEYGTDLTCDDLCPGVCDQGSSLCGSYTGASTGECVGPIGASPDVAACGESLPPSAGAGAACDLTHAGGNTEGRQPAPTTILTLGLLLAALARRRTYPHTGVAR